MKKILAALCALPIVVGGIALAHVAEHRAGLTGEKVVPGPGDPDGRGSAELQSAPEAEAVCYRITFRKIGRVNYAHVHLGAAGETGEKIIKLWASKKGKTSPAEGCRRGLSPATIERFHDNPSYLDLHTERFPDGALRGQLRIEG